MVNIDSFIEEFMKALDSTFGNRVFFVGLQGSYSRGEATDSSDIDMVVILDELSFSDIIAYNSLLDNLPHRELLCGFLSGRAELNGWEASDLFHLYFDTKPLKGNLDSILIKLDDETVNRAIKTGACNIYHSCVHNMLYDKSDDILKNLYKSAVFTLQILVYKQTGKFIVKHKDLLTAVSLEDKIIAETFLSLKEGGPVFFEDMSDVVFQWSKRLIIK